MFSYPFHEETYHFPMGPELWKSPDYVDVVSHMDQPVSEQAVVLPEKAGFPWGAVLLGGAAALLFLGRKRK